MTVQTTFPVREKLGELANKALADGKIAPDSDAAQLAAAHLAMPTFTKGTVPLDGNGQAITQPTFEEGAKKPLPQDATSTTIEAPGATPVAPVGTEGVQTPASAPAPGTETVETPQAAGATAAEATAQQIADEYGEFEFEDPDLGTKFTMRAPKQYVEVAKRGYGRRTVYDRSVSYLGNARNVLEPLITDGRIQRLLPLIDRALNDPAFGEYITSGYQRAQQGLPLLQQAQAEAAAVSPQAPAQPQFDPNDPFVDPALAHIQQRQVELDRRLSEWDQQRQQQAQTAQQQQQAAAANAQAMEAAHHDLARRYPGIFKPELRANDPAWQSAVNYAKDYMGHYDLRAAVIFGGDAWQQIERERSAATASPAATALAQTETHLQEAQRQAARASASTVAGGAVSTAVPMVAPPKPIPTNPDGSLKDRAAFNEEILAWHQQFGKLKPA